MLHCNLRKNIYVERKDKMKSLPIRVKILHQINIKNIFGFLTDSQDIKLLKISKKFNFLLIYS